MIFRYDSFDFGDSTTKRPLIEITLSVRGRSILVRGLLDTGADYTLLPMKIASDIFKFQFDLKNDREIWSGAGGKEFYAYQSPEPVTFSIHQTGFRAITWQSHVYFTLEQPIILLGHKGCLEHLECTFNGRQKTVGIKAI